MQFCGNQTAKNMQNISPPVLYLIPVPIAEGDLDWIIPLNVKNEIINLQYFIVENAKSARQFLKQVNPDINWGEIVIVEMDKHKGYEQNEDIINIMKSSHKVGLMSEAGMPCIADPGHHIVRLAQSKGWKVKPMVGPSSILLALISSGMNGNCFKFNGYLPSKPDERKKALQQLEKESQSCTQLFIEAPYRNDKMINDLLQFLKPETRLLIAWDITGSHENLISKKVSEWKKNKPEIGKVPTLFAIGI